MLLSHSTVAVRAAAEHFSGTTSTIALSTPKACSPQVLESVMGDSQALSRLWEAIKDVHEFGNGQCQPKSTKLNQYQYS
jgi:hypothetical protein